MIHIFSENIHLKLALQYLIDEEKQACLASVSCPCSLLIVDATDITSANKFDEIDHACICSMIILTNRDTDANILRMVKYPYPTAFLSLQLSLDDIREYIHCEIQQVRRKARCFYAIGIPTEIVSIISESELIAVRLFSQGEEVSVIAKKLKVSVKTVQNYISKAMRKLKTEMSVSVLLLFVLYDKWHSLKKGTSLQQHGENLCVQRKFYLRTGDFL